VAAVAKALVREAVAAVEAEAKARVVLAKAVGEVQALERVAAVTPAAASVVAASAAAARSSWRRCLHCCCR
jgi:hypothetical protein